MDTDGDTLTVAEVIAAKLKAIGTTHFFCLTGGDQALWIALVDAGITVVNCRSEQSATYMADGFARVSGGVAFVYGQAGPGVANVAGSLAEPFWAQTPIISLTSASPFETRYSYAYQELEQLGLHGSVTRWSGAVLTPSRAAALLDRAVRVAVGPPSGPVHIELPGPMFRARVAREEPMPSLVEPRFTTAAPQPEAVRAVADVLRRAERPMVLAGHGAVVADAAGEIVALAERHQLPVATTLGGKGAISEDHPLAVGVVGRYSAKVANDLLAQADVVLALGTRLGTMATDSLKVPRPGCKILHVDTDPEVLGNNFAETVSVLADVKLLVAELIVELDRDPPAPSPGWADGVRAGVARWRAERDASAIPMPDGAIQPGSVVRAIRLALASQDLLFADTGYMAAWTGALYPVTSTGRVYHRAVGSLGWAFAASLGGTFAADGRRVACVIGDGGFGYHVGDIETALRHDLDTTIVILNNQSLAFEYHIQKYQYGGRIVPQVNDFVDVDYAAVATAFGAWGQRVTDPADLDDAVRAATSHPGLAILDVAVDKEAIAPVTVYDAQLTRAL